MLSRRSLQLWYLVHKWTSLVCTVFILLLCLTGLPLIFADEIDHLLGNTVQPAEMPGTARRADLDAIVADALLRKLGNAVQFLVAEPNEPDLWYVRMGKTVDAPEPSAFFIYDARSGKFLQEYPLDRGIMHALLRLHVDLFAGLPGMLFLGFMGGLLAVSLVSGTVLYGCFMRKLAFGTIRRKRSSRVTLLDLHNLLGIVTLVWLLVVGVTGVINTLSIPIFSRWQSTELAEMTAHFPRRPALVGEIAVQKAVAAAYLAEPDMRLSFMAFPGNGFAGPYHFTAFMQGATPWTSKLLKPLLIDAHNGQVVEKRELPGYVSMLLLSRPLHFGDYGGMPLKIIWALLDVFAIFILGSGLYLWLKKSGLPTEARLIALTGANGNSAQPISTAAKENA